MPRSSRETIKDALEKCIFLHESKDYATAEIILRQIMRAFSEEYYTDSDELSKEKLSKGMELLCQHKVNEALPLIEEAYRLQPDSRTAFINSIYCNFHTSNYKRVWELYEDRLKHFDQLIAYKNMFNFDKKWNGTDSIQDKTVLVFCEQGLGDTIHFSRYLKHLKACGCKIVLNCSKVLKRLFESESFKFIVDEIVCKEDVTVDWMPKYDYHLPLLSLPYLLELYEPHPETYIEIYDKNYYENSKINVGFLWKGNPSSGNDKIRSVNINWFRQLMLPGVELHSLHHEEKPLEGMVSHIKEIDDLYDVAKIINSLDLIVTVDTAVLHLAGAMGKKVWGLIPFNCDFRWKLTGDRSIWYPNVRLFRQEYPDDWDGVFKKVAKKLHSWKD